VVAGQEVEADGVTWGCHDKLGSIDEASRSANNNLVGYSSSRRGRRSGVFGGECESASFTGNRSTGGTAAVTRDRDGTDDCLNITCGKRSLNRWWRLSRLLGDDCSRARDDISNDVLNRGRDAHYKVASTVGV